ncbi:MAG: BT_3928 family protein [Chitinophagaceae bacterium]
MQKIIVLIRWIVGLLFIFSGLIKANDPLGLSYKMNEFFEVFNLHQLNQFSLAFAITMNVFEIVAGIAIIVGRFVKPIIAMLTALIVFFTFLTGYALFSGKIKTCGCFGDCIPLTPAVSFGKDIALFILIVFLWLQQKKINSTISNKNATIALAFISIAVIALQFNALENLPIIDCLPYKKGNSIVEQMKKPADYLPDSTEINYQYKKNGEMISFDQNHFPENFDSTYEYVGREDKIIRKGSGFPKIIDFTLQTIYGTDTTASIFALPKYVLVMGTDFPKDYAKWEAQLVSMKAACDKKNIPLFYVTSQSNQTLQTIISKGVSVLKCDAITIKTAARVNSTYFFMQQSTIIEKQSWKSYQLIQSLL